jgi:hypothetical protein
MLAQCAFIDPNPAHLPEADFWERLGDVASRMVLGGVLPGVLLGRFLKSAGRKSRGALKSVEPGAFSATNRLQRGLWLPLDFPI